MTIEIVCQQCDTTFVVRFPSQKRRFCSRLCSNRHSHNARTLRTRKPKFIDCECCGSPFPFRTHGDKPPPRFCSIQCTNDHRRGVPSGKTKVPQEIARAMHRLYPMHGSDETAAMLGIDRKYVQSFASRVGLKLAPETARRLVHDPTRQRMIRSNPMTRDDVKAKVAEWRNSNPDAVADLFLKLREGNHRLQRDKPSGLERRFHAILDSLNVRYEYAVMLKTNFVVDVRIGALILEADGDWWHGHPRFEPLNTRQLAQQKRDRSRDKYLTACGYTVVRIWESDMAREVVEAVLRHHGLLGGN